MADNKSHWTPVQDQIIWFYEEAGEELTSTMWDKSDPYLLRLYHQGKVFALHAEAIAAQATEQSHNITDFSKMRISELIAFAEAQARIEQQSLSADDPDRDAKWMETLEALRLMKERGVPKSLRDE